MEQGLLTKSKFFVDAFNTAIIDGPLRIYFSDKQESEALHIYFEIQESLAQNGLHLTTLAGASTHAFVMLYPDGAIFDQIFSNNTGLAIDQFGENIILGLKAPHEKTQRQEISQKVSQIIQTTAVL